MIAKTIALFIAFAALSLLASCSETEWDDTVIVNRSSAQVEFMFYPAGEFVLPPGSSIRLFESRPFQHMAWFSYYGHSCATCEDGPPFDPLNCIRTVRYISGVTGGGYAIREFRSICQCESPGGSDCAACTCDENNCADECDGCDCGGCECDCRASAGYRGYCNCNGASASASA